MNTVKSILAWLFGILFLLTGLGFILKSVFVALPFIIAALFCLPPARQFVYKYTKKELPLALRIILIISVMAVSGMQMEAFETAQKEKVALKKQEEALLAFQSERGSIIEKINQFIASDQPKAALNLSEKYLFTKDSEISKLHIQAKKTHQARTYEARTKEIIASLKGIPESDYNKNLKLYKELIVMNPGNRTYKDKRDFYQKKVIEQQAAAKAKEKRLEKIKNQFSAWDGSHMKLERQIKASMHDPGSYDHVKTVYWDHGDYLLVQTNFRGKNVLGGLVMNSIKAKVSENGNILQIIQ